MTGRDVLKQEGVWQVSMGERISAFNDAWIPGLPNHRFRTEGRTGEEDNLKVNQLIEPGRRRWNMERIRRNTTEAERSTIAVIHISQSSGEDKLVWPTTLDVVARPKLVYRRLREMSHTNTMANTVKEITTQEKKWSNLWKSKGIPKVKKFLWRVSQMAPPVNTELVRRGIQTTQTCPFCNEIETVCHAMLNCEWTRRVWFGGMGIRVESGDEIQWETWLSTMHEIRRT